MLLSSFNPLPLKKMFSSFVRKKEKISHCTTVSEYLSIPSTKTSPDLTKFLSTAVDMFFTLLDDQVFWMVNFEARL